MFYTLYHFSKELCDIYNIPVEFVMRILDLHNLMVLTALSGG